MNIERSNFTSEAEKLEMARKVFKRLNKHRIIQAMEKKFGLTDTDLQNYLDSWESKIPEPIYIAPYPVQTAGFVGNSLGHYQPYR
jgi:hypothetical protein